MYGGVYMEFWDNIKGFGKKTLDIAKHYIRITRKEAIDRADVVMPIIEHPFDLEKQKKDREARREFKAKYGYRKAAENYVKEAGEKVMDRAAVVAPVAKYAAKKIIDRADVVMPIIEHPFDLEEQKKDREARRKFKAKYGYRKVAKNYIKERTDKVKPAIDWTISKVAETPMGLVAGKFGEYFSQYLNAPEKPADVPKSSDKSVNSPAPEVKKELSENTDDTSNANIPFALKCINRQTGVSIDKIKEYVFPHLAQSNEDVTKVGRILSDFLGDQSQFAFFRNRFTKNMKESSNPEYIFADLYRAVTDDKGLISRDVENSPAFGPMIKMFRNNIPEEIRNVLPENESALFMYATLSRMVSTQEGKEATINALSRLHPGADLTKITQETGFDKIMGRESLNELLLRPHWQKYHDKLQTEKISIRTEKLTGGLSGILRKATPQSVTAQTQGISARLMEKGDKEKSSQISQKVFDNTFALAAAKKYSNAA